MAALDKLMRKAEEDSHKKKAPKPKKDAKGKATVLEAKPLEEKPSEPKAPDTKLSDAKTSDVKLPDAEYSAAKLSDVNSSDSKPVSEPAPIMEETTTESKYMNNITLISESLPKRREAENIPVSRDEPSVSPKEEPSPDRSENKGGRPNERGEKNKDYKMLNVAIPISLYNSLKEMGGGNMTYFARTLLQEGIDNRKNTGLYK